MDEILTRNTPTQNWMADKEKRANIYFIKAKYEVDDEFYTSFEEIRAEMQDYRAHFKDKVVVCPCNDGKKSNFYRYFAVEELYIFLALFGKNINGYTYYNKRHTKIFEFLNRNCKTPQREHDSQLDASEYI